MLPSVTPSSAISGLSNRIPFEVAPSTVLLYIWLFGDSDNSTPVRALMTWLFLAIESVMFLEKKIAALVVSSIKFPSMRMFQHLSEQITPIGLSWSQLFVMIMS